MSSKYRTDSYPYKVYTALVTQTGIDTESSINSGTLTVGVSYRINEASAGMDFTNVGAPDNNLNTSFVATGTSPNSWGTGATYTLAYSEGAPVVKVLENTIGNVYWQYAAAGRYKATLLGAFPPETTFCQGTIMANSDGAGIKSIATLIPSTDFVLLVSSNSFEAAKDDSLLDTPIEIRVYQ